MSGFGPAHAVLIDAALFLAGQVVDDDRTALVWDAMTRALPDAEPLGQPPIDRIAEAAADLVTARAALTQGRANAGTEWAAANWALRQAVTNYAWSRLTRSAAALSTPT